MPLFLLRLFEERRRRRLDDGSYPTRRYVMPCEALSKHIEEKDVEVRLLVGEAGAEVEGWRRGVVVKLDEETGILLVRLVPREDENSTTPTKSTPLNEAPTTTPAPAAAASPAGDDGTTAEQEKAPADAGTEDPRRRTRVQARQPPLPPARGAGSRPPSSRPSRSRKRTLGARRAGVRGSQAGARARERLCARAYGSCALFRTGRRT